MRSTRPSRVSSPPENAAQRTFKQQHPSTQRIAKTDLAKHENPGTRCPTSLAAAPQESFVHFVERLDQRQRFEPDTAGR